MVTLAEVETTHPMYPVRRSEYMMCLHKILNYNYPTILIKSETARVDKSCVHELHDRFTDVIDIPSTRELGAGEKSQQEYVSIKQFINTNPPIDDEAWIVKLSGRYMLIDDTFMDEVKNAPPETQGVIKLFEDGNKMYTFCYALRYKWFKSFYKYPVQFMGYLNIERFILECIKIENIFKNVKKLDRLGIITNVNNENKYQIF